MRYIVVDLEATCWKRGTRSGRMEIIEIGAVNLASASGPASSEFVRFVRPTKRPVLSDYCTQLTGIRQQDVDRASTFPAVFQSYLNWIGEEPFVQCSWGDYDLQQFRTDCRRHGIPFPDAFEQHINLKIEFSRIYGVKLGMKGALKHLGLSLEGRHHRGIDDARNLAKIAKIILPAIVGK